VAYNFATPAASTVSLQGINIAALEQSWSVIVSIVSNPSDSGSLTIKSREMVWNGNALGSEVMGNSAGLLGFVLILDIWQVAHPLIYSVV